MNMNLIEVILLCTTVIFAMIAAFLIIAKIIQRKTVIKALENSVGMLKTQLTHNEATLKNTLEPMLTPDLGKKISELVAVERDSYKNLIKLYVDYHPAASEMMPFLMNQIIASYIQCFEHIVLLQPSKTEQVQAHNKTESATAQAPQQEASDELPENFQFEALIEQLRYEKQDFANKYKDASKLLKTICADYKEQLKLNVDDSLEHMNISDIAKLLNIEFTPTKTVI